ncbi:MAG: leucyl aminopeptidase, partial [Pseudomonadota bacterium]
QALLKLPAKQAVVALESVNVKGNKTPWKLQTIMHAISQDAYRYNAHKSKPADPPQLSTVRLLVKQRGPNSQAVRLGNALDAGLQFSRDLGNEPPNVCDPAYLLRQARKLARHDKVKVSNLDERKMASLGMGAFLAVSQGSNKPGQMIIIQYQGDKKSNAPIALVGKGITFDTGGISLKPPGAMDEMKFDMCGAAAVLGATKAVIEAKLPINLVTIVAAAENMPSGGATRPADIVTSASGKTIEILNTDAEGRLVLCDALTQVQTYKPKAIIDVATLTGACIVALGSHASALYANEDKLAEDLLAAGEESGDRAWRMPLWDEYQSALRSNFADMANIGGREAGSVTAACFLQRFINEGVSWAHMDVAGSAFHGGARKGSSGRPVPLLFRYLCQQSGL